MNIFYQVTSIIGFAAIVGVFGFLTFAALDLLHNLVRKNEDE